MAFFKSDVVRCSLWVWAFICLTYASHGQTNFTYTGPFQIGDYAGVADFSYRYVENDSLLNGPFSFKSSDLSALIGEGDDYFSITGAFNDNIPGGSWQFQFGEFQEGGDATFSDNQYKVNVNGTQHSAQGRFVGGKPDGPWVQTVRKIQNSSVESIPFKSSFEFKLGIPQYSFRIENESMTLVGRFLRDGLAHDQWELFGIQSPEAMERWQFSEGLLRKIYIDTPGDKQEITVFKPTDGPTQDIRLDERYMKLLAVKQQIARESVKDSHSNIFALLTENARYYQKVETILSAFISTSFTTEFKVRVPYYPLNADERAQLDSIKSVAQATEQIRKFLFEDTQLQLMQHANEEVAFLMAAMDSVNQSELIKIHQLLIYDEQGLIEFMPREELLTLLELHVLPDAAIDVSYSAADGTKTGTYQTPKPMPWMGNSTGLDIAFQSAQMTYRAMDSTQRTLFTQLTQKQQEARLAAIEEELVGGLNRLTDKVDSLAIFVNGPPMGAIRSVEETSRNLLRIYSQEEDVDIKVSEADKLVACFEQMEGLTLTLSKLPIQDSAVSVVYTDQVWNPFTFTIMEEEVKKRITSAYRDVLIPYVLDGIRENLTCENIDDWTVLLESIHNRLFQLRDEDTKRLERKLRKTNDPGEILDLFEIDVNS